MNLDAYDWLRLWGSYRFFSCEIPKHLGLRQGMGWLSETGLRKTELDGTLVI